MASIFLGFPKSISKKAPSPELLVPSNPELFESSVNLTLSIIALNFFRK